MIDGPYRRVDFLDETAGIPSHYITGPGDVYFDWNANTCEIINGLNAAYAAGHEAGRREASGAGGTGDLRKK